jgi:hypothetical protein
VSGKSPWMGRAPHGTDARARWHWRQGHKPLRKFCELCADAAMIARHHRNDSSRTAWRQAA